MGGGVRDSPDPLDHQFDGIHSGSAGEYSSPLGDDEHGAERGNGVHELQRAIIEEYVPVRGCSVYFIEPLDWVIKQVMESESERYIREEGVRSRGNLRCPNPQCRVVIGEFGFKSSYQCSCGYTTSTYFAVEINRVDRLF